MRVHSPDGRVWTVSRRPERSGALSTVLPGRWTVEARSDDEVRRWKAASRRAAGELIETVALSLRTGMPGPPGELPAEDAT